MAQIEFVEQRKVIIEPYQEAPVHDFIIIDKEGNNLTDELIAKPQYHFLFNFLRFEECKQKCFCYP